MINNKKAICYSMVKNEADIIEIFIRHNLHYFDHMIITDNNSSDNTVIIINNLISEGLPITLWHDHSLAHEQSRITTEAYHKISRQFDFDLFFPLDADELITIDENSLLNEINNDPCYITKFVNYVTTTESDTTTNMTRRLKKEEKNKIFINQKYVDFKAITINQGNHSILYNGVEIPPVYIPSIRINHFGVRGIQHYLKKYIIGSQAMILLHENYIKGKSIYAVHWYKEYEFIKQKQCKISFLEYLQKTYQVNSVEELNKLTIEDPIFFDMNLKYTHCANFNLPYALLLNYENLANEYWEAKKINLMQKIATSINKTIKQIINKIKVKFNKKVYKLHKLIKKK